MTINELNNLVGIVGEYISKMNVICNAFRKANDYQSWLKAVEDTSIMRSCFVKLGNLYVDTHSADVDISMELIELLNEILKIASNRCLVVPDDDVIEDNENACDIDITERYVYMIQSFECDFLLARNNMFDLSQLDLFGSRISKDIELLEELSYLLRHKIVKIVMKGVEKNE